MLTQQTLNFKPQLTAQLAQTMRLLQLSTAELAALIDAELAANPALEVVTASRCPSCGRRLKTLDCPICDRHSSAVDEPIVYVTPRSARARDIDFVVEIEPRATETLAEYVRRQIAPALSIDDQSIADYLLANLDERGFLLETPQTCAKILNVPLDRVRKVVQVIQRADPPGVGACAVRESLLLQLDSLAGAEANRALAHTLIADHWEQLAHYQLKQLARQLRVTLTDLEAAVSFIRQNLTPYPAQAYWGNRRGQSVEVTYAEPDVIIHAPLENYDEPFSIQLFSPAAGWLRVNKRFKAALDDCPVTDRQRLAECVEQAELLVHGLEQRSATLQRLLAAMVREQRAYLLGYERDPIPMTRARLARQLSLHESTVSRAVADKIVALPNGRLVPLDQFFDQSLAVRHALKAIIAAEQHPMSDDELARQLCQQGYSVARRTVAKYRDMERIPPFSERVPRVPL